MGYITGIPIYGYKGFAPGFKCRNYKYSLDRDNRFDEPLNICKSGLHFSEHPCDVFRYYYPDMRYYSDDWNGEPGCFARVVAPAGSRIVRRDGKIATNCLRILEVLTADELRAKIPRRSKRLLAKNIKKALKLLIKT